MLASRMLQSSPRRSEPPLKGPAYSSPEKIELLVRATNARAIHLYSKLGFIEEGRFRNRVRLPDDEFVDDIAMAWFPRREPNQE